MQDNPIFSMEAEQAVLGGLMIDPTAWDRISDVISGHDFYNHVHRTIYESIRRMAEAGQVVDVITVAEALESSGKLDAAGGLAYLVDMAQITPSAANIRRHAELVRRNAVKRDLGRAGYEVSQLVRADKDPEDMLGEAERLVMQVRDQADGITQKPYVVLKDILGDMLDEMSIRLSSGSSMLGLPTGFTDLDNLTKGFKPGELIILGARPGMGKTSLALQMAFAAAEQQPVLFVSLEMLQQSLTQRLTAAVGRVPLARILDGSAAANDDDGYRLTAALGRMSTSRLMLRFTPTITVPALRSLLRRINRENAQSGRCGMVVIDYMQLIQPTDDLRRSSRYEQVTEISRSLKALALEFEVPILVLSQLSRDVESRPNKRPISADLRDSGQLEQDADIILFIYRDEVYNPDSADKGTAEILVTKQRNGATGTEKLAWSGECTRFDNFSWRGYSQSQNQPANNNARVGVFEDDLQ